MIHFAVIILLSNYIVHGGNNSGESGLLELDTDGVGPQSGSPVYVFDNGVRKVIGVLIGSPVSPCQDGHIWASRLTPGATDRRKWDENQAIYH